MALCPFASWRRLPGSEPAITPRTVIFHTMVGYLTSTDDYFRSGRSGGIEAHFGVGGRWGPDAGAGLDGAVWQWRDTGEQADANFHANGFAVSIETADNAPASAADLAPWTPAQVATLIRLGRWLRTVHGIPARICRDPTDAGFGWHAMWGAPSEWTPAAGKVCPGAARIDQLRATVLPAIFSDTGEVDMPLTDADVDRVAAAVNAKIVTTLRTGLAGSPDIPVRQWAAQLDTVNRVVGPLANDEAAVLAAIDRVKSGVADSKDAVLGALAAMPTGSFTDEQVQALADHLHISAEECAKAVRMELSRGLAE